MAKFDLAALMGAAEVSNLDTMQMQEIPLDLIDDNEGNFYGIREIEELAEAIALIGLQQPLVVMPMLGIDGERYKLIAGHRRKAALLHNQAETAPCIVRTPMNSAYEELMLIMTNSTGRELTYKEKMEQVKRVEARLMELKEQGVELPGKMRARVAEITKVSESEIARMKFIDKNLEQVWREPLSKGEINPTVANAIAHLTPERQNSFYRDKFDFPKKRFSYEQEVKLYDEEQDAKPWTPKTCPAEESGTKYYDCWTQVAKCRERLPDVTCCHTCPEVDGCKDVCFSQRRYKTPEQLDAERQSAMDAEQAERRAFLQTRAGQIPQRIQSARLAKNWSEEQLGNELWCAFETLDEDDVELWENATGEGDLPSIGEIMALSQVLECSSDYLLGLSDVLRPSPKVWHDRSEHPVDDTLVLMLSRRHTGDNFHAAIFQGKEFWHPESPNIEMPDGYQQWQPLTLPEV